MTEEQKAPYLAISAHDFAGDNMLADGRLALILPGRRGAGQADALLTRSGLIELGDKNTHHPFLVFRVNAASLSVFVETVRDARQVAKYPPETPVLAQWPGKYRSDWFFLTAGDISAHLQRIDAQKPL